MYDKSKATLTTMKNFNNIVIKKEFYDFLAATHSTLRLSQYNGRWTGGGRWGCCDRLGMSQTSLDIARSTEMLPLVFSTHRNNPLNQRNPP